MAVDGEASAGFLFLVAAGDVGRSTPTEDIQHHPVRKYKNLLDSNIKLNWFLYLRTEW